MRHYSSIFFFFLLSSTYFSAEMFPAVLIRLLKISNKSFEMDQQGGVWSRLKNVVLNGFIDRPAKFGNSAGNNRTLKKSMVGARP